jgi:hypothetical protein
MVAGGGKKSQFNSQQGFSAVGNQGVADRSEGGLMLGSHVTTASAAVVTTPSPLSSALNMVSSDQDDSVFSPSSVEDERMKMLEQVRTALITPPLGW